MQLLGRHPEIGVGADEGWSLFPPARVVADDEYRSPIFFQILGCFAWECVAPNAWGDERA